MFWEPCEPFVCIAQYRDGSDRPFSDDGANDGRDRVCILKAQPNGELTLEGSATFTAIEAIDGFSLNFVKSVCYLFYQHSQGN